MKLILIVSLFLLFGCHSRKEEQKSEATKDEKTIEKKQSAFSEQAESVYIIETYDGQRILEKGMAFQLTSTTLVAPFSLFRNATRALLTPINGGDQIEISDYYLYDRINNVILLFSDKLQSKPLKLYGAENVQGMKTILLGRKRNNTLPLITGSYLQEKIVQGRKLFNITNTILKSSIGAPVFVSTGSVLGMGFSEEVMYEKQYFVVPAMEILTLIKKRNGTQTIASIGTLNSDKNKAVERITLVTDFGDISIRLYNETPAYRDNFLQLAREGFYDSLLIHRLIKDFGIQTGAADTRHAKSDDIVGWKGPGYTLPAHVISSLFHKRGAIGSPRKPDDKNKKRRSDGSQFYIVTGRIYHEDELDELEEQNGIQFTEQQRDYYTSIGGAPHLDGLYTVFGEVASGIDVAERMTHLPVKGDFRPIRDVRLEKVIIHE